MAILSDANSPSVRSSHRRSTQAAWPARWDQWQNARNGTGDSEGGRRTYGRGANRFSQAADTGAYRRYRRTAFRRIDERERANSPSDRPIKAGDQRMICKACASVLTQRNAFGEPIIRNRGIVAKTSGLYLICPRCKAAVPFDMDVLRVLAPDTGERRLRIT